MPRFSVVFPLLCRSKRPKVWELVQAGGWVMVPILLCSVAALAIIVERAWALRTQRICPRHLVSQIWQWARSGQLDAARITDLRAGSPLGRVLAAGLVNRHHSREVMKESIEEAGRHVVLELERYLNSLGTIASVTPLLGLLGTVLGMIKVFTVITTQGVGSPTDLAGGISEALITTAAGLTVAIPALMFYRHYQRRVDELVATMEQEALKMVEILHGEREAGEESLS
ncbi:MAG TPA: MotA/TolQ/ExbB proton channel family protein [Gammaproteobacteria bacterium]|nr:MotA/TolQ/ExbB proton channel family protein [Gammaproteobacteria bacterium]